MNRRDILIGSAAIGAASSIGGIAMSKSVSGFVVPPEEAKHERTFMQWPASRQVHSESAFLKMLEQTIADIANIIAEFEPVILLAAKADHQNARTLLSDRVELWDIPTEDLWCRDSGPLFAKRPDGELVVSHLQFNGWGGKQIHKRDGLIPSGANADSRGIPNAPKV